MAYNFDRVPNRRIASPLNKWTIVPQDVLPMWIADMDFSATRYFPSVRVTNPQATYLAWLDCTALELKPSPYEFFLKKAKIASQ